MCKLEVSDSASVSASSVVSGGNTDSLVCSWLFFNLRGAEEPGVTARSAAGLQLRACPGLPRHHLERCLEQTPGEQEESFLSTRTAQGSTGQPDTLTHSKILHKRTARRQLLGEMLTQSLASILCSLLPTATSTEPVSCFTDKANIPMAAGKAAALPPVLPLPTCALQRF